MAITATPASPRTLTKQRIRMAMRDVAGAVPNTGVLNVLLDNVEFSDDEIDGAIAFTVDWWNSITPMSRVAADQINSFLLFQGVVSMLFQSESMRQLRNQATVGDGDVTPIGIDDKSGLYAQMSQVAMQRFELGAKQVKIQQNMEACYGHVSSGYSYIGRLGGGNF